MTEPIYVNIAQGLVEYIQQLGALRCSMDLVTVASNRPRAGTYPLINIWIKQQAPTGYGKINSWCETLAAIVVYPDVLELRTRDPFCQRTRHIELAHPQLFELLDTAIQGVRASIPKL